jgi:hypothetical protein
VACPHTKPTTRPKAKIGKAKSRFSRAPLRSMKMGSTAALKSKEKNKEKIFIGLSWRKVRSIRPVMPKVKKKPSRAMRRKMPTIILPLIHRKAASGASSGVTPIRFETPAPRRFRDLVRQKPKSDRNGAHS